MLRQVPIVVSVAALIVAVVGLARAPRSVPQQDRTNAVTYQEYQQLQQEVRMLRAALAQRNPLQQQVALAPEAPGPATPASDVPTPRYVRFDAPRGVAIEATDNGAIAVRNDDPTMAGKVLVVKADRDDGTSESLTIVVPPPAR